MELVIKPKKTNLSPLKAIRKYCKENCCMNDFKSWKECELINCPLFEYRFGANPNRKGVGNKNPKKYIKKRK